MQEIWKDIEGYECLYQVSNLGNVKSFDRKIKHLSGFRLKKGRLLKFGISNGYNYVNLCNENTQKSFKIHRLVANAFISNINNKITVNHIDGNKLNNYVSNLEWATYSENIIHAHKTGLKKGTWKGIYGKLNPSSKAVVQYDLNGNFIKEYESTYDVERKTGMCNRNISAAARGARGTVFGFIWEYKN